MATLVVVHGAWLSGWAWKKMRPLLRDAGHEVFIPSLTGLGERSHVATPEVGLETHIQDVVNVLFYEDLRDVTLIAHSYGRIEPPGVASDTTPEDVGWIMERRAPQPRRTFLEPVHLSGAIDRLPRTYIYCLQAMQGDVFRQFAARSQSEAGWRYEKIDSRRNANITAPQDLAEILLRLVAN